MADDEKTKRFGRAVTMLFTSMCMLLVVYGCSKSETEQSGAEPAGKVMEKAGDTLDQVTEKTKTIADEVTDKAAKTAKDAYDAAGNAVKETTDMAKDAYQSADRMVSDAVKSGSDQVPSALEMKNPSKDAAKQGGDAVETQFNKALESVPSLPGK